MIANNYLVIMAGGIGSRFWPYSRDRRPKQFLDFFGTGRSLLQMTVDRFRELVPVENMLVVTNIAYRDMILEQVPDLRAELVLCEPCRRNTAPCIAYATERIRALAAEKGLAEEKVRVVVAASDHLITNEREFVRVIGQGLDYVGTHDVLLTLGMRPTRPETGYGYIRVRKDAGEAITPVMAFTEKPDALRAEQFLRSGDYLWNSGMFVWNLRAIDTALGRYLPEVTAQLWAEGVYGTEREAPSSPSVSRSVPLSASTTALWRRRRTSAYCPPTSVGATSVHGARSMTCRRKMQRAMSASIARRCSARVAAIS